MWAMPSARNVGQPIGQRSQQQSLLPTQQSQALQQTQQQQDDLFSSSSQLPNSQLGFRFGGQNAVGPQSQPQTGGSDDFPPLSRNMNGDIGQDRAPGLQNVGMGGQSSISTYGIGAGQNIRSNGLLNALSSNSRATGATSQVSSPANIGGVNTCSYILNIAHLNLELSSYGSARDNLRQEPGDFEADTVRIPNERNYDL
jgi:CCR4-NOT transcription complex subunit 2